MANIIYGTRFETIHSLGSANYETENEMYLMMEQENLIEDNPFVIGITYYEFQKQENDTYKCVRSWDFGKPYQGKW